MIAAAQRSALASLITLCALAAPSCSCEPDGPERIPDAALPSAATVVVAPPPPPPRELYLPDGGDQALEGEPPSLAPPQPSLGGGRCPAEMVDVAGQFCIDRYEVSLIDRASRQPLSPYYHPTFYGVRVQFQRWERRRAAARSGLARELAVPAPPEWQLTRAFEPEAVSSPNVVPHGYLSGIVAELACRNAGKRLCRAAEWVQACRGQARTKFPYGPVYEVGRCNVHRDAHPAALLHGNASINHLDPRLNQVSSEGEPLLRRTGLTSDCRSAWGADAIYDMVGNLDEWVEDETGAFQGGFYARATKEGCDARISSHPPEYYDYSLGTRCCRD